MTLTLFENPSITGFTYLSFMFKTISRFNIKHHSVLSDIVTIRSLSLYPFFFLILKRNNSLSTDKELFSIRQKSNPSKNINVSEQTSFHLWEYVNVSGQSQLLQSWNCPHYLLQSLKHHYSNNSKSKYADNLTLTIKIYAISTLL